WRLRQDRGDVDAMKAAAAETVAAAKGTPLLESGAAAPARTGGAVAAIADGSNGSGGNGAPQDTPAPGRAPAARVPENCTVNVAILPAHDEADEISGVMLAQLLEFRGYCAFPQPVTRLASELLETVEQKAAHVVVVSAMPPAAVAHSRYLCKRLHARFPEQNMVVGLWTMKGDLQKASERVACAGTVQVSSTF